MVDACKAAGLELKRVSGLGCSIILCGTSFHLLSQSIMHGVFA